MFESPTNVYDRQQTPYGEPSAPIEEHEVSGEKCLVLFRHGKRQVVHAHRVNYRANIWALKLLGAAKVIAYATTGSIDPNLPIGSFVVPDQIIDYTHNRESSFQNRNIKEHFDFSYPFTPELRQLVIEAAKLAGLNPQEGGVYACTQGPRFETAAEIAKYGRDGCSIVGMTLMPEAPLARQLELEYAALALVMNPGAGLVGKVDIPGSYHYTDQAVAPIQKFNKYLVSRSNV